MSLGLNMEFQLMLIWYLMFASCQILLPSRTRNQTGEDQAVYDYVMNHEESEDFTVIC